jgi:hypothetical protein
MTHPTPIEAQTVSEAEKRVQKATQLIAEGHGDEDVAVAVFGRSDGFTLAAARGLRLEVQSRAGGR